MKQVSSKGKEGSFAEKKENFSFLEKNKETSSGLRKSCCGGNAKLEVVPVVAIPPWSADDQ